MNNCRGGCNHNNSNCDCCNSPVTPPPCVVNDYKYVKENISLEGFCSLDCVEVCDKNVYNFNMCNNTVVVVGFCIKVTYTNCRNQKCTKCVPATVSFLNLPPCISAYEVEVIEPFQVCCTQCNCVSVQIKTAICYSK